jgi:hypothetical protein
MSITHYQGSVKMPIVRVDDFIKGRSIDTLSVDVHGGATKYDELVQKSKPASLTKEVGLHMPFTFNDAEKVEEGLQQWSRTGDPCLAVKMLSLSSPGRDSSTSISSSPVDVFFWFNRNLDDLLYAACLVVARPQNPKDPQAIETCFARPASSSLVHKILKTPRPDRGTEASSGSGEPQTLSSSFLV